MATSSETPSDVEYQYYDVLRNNRNKIANLINLTCLLPLLRAKGLLTESESKLLEEMSPETQHNRINRGAQLVQILLDKKGGRNVLNVFIEALREENEHMGHKSLAFELLAELSKLPPPPSLSVRARALTLPEKSARSKVRGQHLPKHTPFTTRSFSESEGSALAMGHAFYPEHIDSSQQHLDNAHHLKHMSKKLQRTLALQHNTMQTVCHLAKVIADMQEKMSTMQHLISVLLDNNQKNSGIYATVSRNGNYGIKHSLPRCEKSNEYVDSPFFTHADTDSINSFTIKLDTGIHQIFQMNQEEAVMCIQLDYLLPELQKRKLVTDFEFRQLSDNSSTPEEKNRFLMNIIESKGEEKSFNLFIQALEAEQWHTKHKYLAKVLRDAKEVLISQLIDPPKLPPKPQKDPVPECMAVSNTNCESSDGLYDDTRAVKPRIQQVRFVEEEKLANGKNGEVWLALDKKEGTKVVIKKPITTEKFMQEKYVLANIRHANVIRLIDSSITESPILVFEYAVNGNLRNYLKSFTNGFSISKLLIISTDVACGMLELEKRNIIHCDVKAKSILIDSHFVCKVASFSKAQCLKPGKSSYVPLSNLIITIATKWAAPEILSERKFSVKSDVWAFGVLLSEVFSQGSTPYPNMNSAKVKSNVQNGIKMAQPSDCPNDVYEVMKSCFELHAENRPLFTVVHQQLMELHCKNSMSEASSSGSYIEDL